MKKWQAVIEKLAPKLADDAILEGEACLPYSADRWGRSGPPPVVFLPRTHDEVALIAGTLYSAGLPFLARGRGTGMTGGALPLGRSAVLSLEKMDRILKLDPEAFELHVEAGALLSEVQAAANSAGLFYPPDPASAEECSIGGNLAENAGGLSCLKYGVTGEYVLALKMVLPDGRSLELGSRARKDVAGFDLKRLVIGSEGLLGIITSVVLRLIPRPEAEASLLAWFETSLEATKTLQRVFLAGSLPSRAELIAGESLKILADEGVKIHPGAKALILFGFDGPEFCLPQELKLARAVIETRALATSLAPGDEAEKLWEIRSALSPALKKLAPLKVNEDISLPLNQLSAGIEYTENLAKRHGLKIAVFGHAGDGNLHVNFMIEPEDLAKTEEAVGELFLEVRRLGGSITGEHGIGLAKAPWLAKSLDPLAIELSREIKKIFDPKNLLNPGKVFYGPSQDEITRLI